MAEITVQYDHGNQRVINLDCLGIRVLEHTPVMAGKQFLYNDTVIKLRLVYNGKKNSYARPVGNNFPLVTANAPPVITEGALRAWLSRPRGKLDINWGGAGTTMLTPLITDGEFDSDYGPETIKLEVSEAVGVDGTYFISWTIRVRIVESNLGTPQKAVLGHIWEMKESLEGGPNGYFGVRTTTGKVHFEAQLLTSLEREPDDYRGWIVVPLVAGYRRAKLEVAVDHRKSILEYYIEDHETPYSITYPNITHIDSEIYSELDWIGWEDAIINMAQGGLEGAKAGTTGTPILGLGVKAAGAITGTTLGLMRSLPKNNTGIVSTIYGNEKSTRDNLLDVAKRLYVHYANRLDTPFSGILGRVTASQTKRMVRLEVAGRGSRLATLTGGTNSMNGIFNKFPRDEDVLGVLQRAPVRGPQPPNSSNTRSRDLRIIVTPGLNDTETTTPERIQDISRNVLPTVP